MPSEGYQAETEVAEITASCNDLFAVNKACSHQQRINNIRWDALLADASVYKRKAVAIQEAKFTLALKAIPEVEALVPPIYPSVQVPLKAQFAALSRLNERYTERLSQLQAGQVALDQLLAQIEHDLNSYPSLASFINTQLECVQQRIDKQSEAINVSSEQVDKIAAQYQEVKQMLDSLGKVAGITADMQLLDEQLKLANTNLVDNQQSAKKIFGNELPSLVSVKDQYSKATEELTQVEADLAGSKVAQQTIREKLLISQQQLKELKRLRIPDVWFGHDECLAISTAMNWDVAPDYWNILISESRKIKLRRNYSRIRGAREQLMADYQAKIGVLEQQIKLQNDAIIGAQEAFKLLQSTQRNLFDMTQRCENGLEVLNTIAATQDLILQLTTDSNNMTVELEAAKRAEAEQQTKEVERQRLIADFIEELTVLQQFSDSLTAQVICLNESLAKKMAAGIPHEVINAENNSGMELIDAAITSLSSRFDELITNAEQNEVLLELQLLTSYQEITSALQFKTTSVDKNIENIAQYRVGQVHAFQSTQDTIDTLLAGFNTYIKQRSYFYQLLDFIERPVKFSAQLLGITYETCNEAEAKYISCATEALKVFANHRDVVSAQAAVKVLNNSAVGFFSNVGSVVTEASLKTLKEYAPEVANTTKPVPTAA